MKKLFPILLTLCVIFAGCPTTDKHVRTIGQDDQANIRIIQLKLLDFEQNGNRSLLDQAAKDLEEIQNRGEYNKKYRAKIFGLFAMVYYYKHDPGKVKKYLEEIEYTNNTEEYSYILKALQEQTDDTRLMVLNKGLREADTTSLIKLRMAGIYFSLKDYRSAAALYDEAFKDLPAEYTKYYGQNRDLAYHYMKNPREKTDAQAILRQSTLSLGQVSSYMAQETDFLENITADKNADQTTLVRRLRDAGYIYDRKLGDKDVCTRKDLAYLLLHVLAYLKNDPSLLNAYSTKYMNTGRKSPIADIRTDAYYFDAALVLVEREIMELPDGGNFFPDKAVSGLEYAEMLKKMKAQ
jgi:hypothetical protein